MHLAGQTGRDEPVTLTITDRTSLAKSSVLLGPDALAQVHYSLTEALTALLEARDPAGMRDLGDEDLDGGSELALSYSLESEEGRPPGLMIEAFDEERRSACVELDFDETQQLQRRIIALRIARGEMQASPAYLEWLRSALR